MRRNRRVKEKGKNSNDNSNRNRNDVLKVKGVKKSYYIKLFNYKRRDKYYYYALNNYYALL